jgi:hypothetical protein
MFALSTAVMSKCADMLYFCLSDRMQVFAVLIAVTQAKAVRPVDQLANCEKTDKNGRHMLGAGCQNSATGAQTKGASKPVSGRHLLEGECTRNFLGWLAARLQSANRLTAGWQMQVQMVSAQTAQVCA